MYDAVEKSLGVDKVRNIIAEGEERSRERKPRGRGWDPMR